MSAAEIKFVALKKTVVTHGNNFIGKEVEETAKPGDFLEQPPTRIKDQEGENP